MSLIHKKLQGWILVACLLVAFLGVVIAQSQVAEASHPGVGGDVLILSTTMGGGFESTQATALGLTSDVRTPAQWADMTAADFASYKAIVLGDPNCVVGPGPLAAAEANRAVWGPMVRGNVVIIGTDPQFHQFQGGTQLTKDGINFAASGSGTGLYVTLSCYYFNVGASTAVPVLDQLGSFKVQGQNGCPDSAVIVNPAHLAMAGSTNASLSGWGCSMHEWFDTFPGSFEVLVKETSGTPADRPYILARGGDPCAKPTITGSGMIVGTGGNDIILGSDGPDEIYGKGGDDIICARGGSDTVWAGDGNDTVFCEGGDDADCQGEGGKDHIFGGPGHDFLYGGPDCDRVEGGDGNDNIDGGGGDDRPTDGVLGGCKDGGLFGQGGEDTINGGLGGNDYIDGGPGNDPDLSGNTGRDVVLGGDGNDQLFGDHEADTLNGGSGNDIIWGSSGNDTINGGPGDDTMVGHDGNDSLTGDAGFDSADGTGGIDTCDAEIEVDCEV
ncbi:MAG: calcium-binding protein [Patescibacteria group bacterium]